MSMGEGEMKDLPATSEDVESTKDVTVIPTPTEETPDDSKAPAVVESESSSLSLL